MPTPDGARRRDPWVDLLASARWIHADQDKPATALTLAVRSPTGSDLLVIVEDIYRQRGRPITEDGSYHLLHGLEPRGGEK